ncbi:MAG: AmpG family muropeptide MFS transporter [Acidovorax temperans]|uniref:AmpG family muropeptide MFS transporter n=1 Tax=Acidovorax temperans TaxID=80878 RepID=UPI00391D83ED
MSDANPTAPPAPSSTPSTPSPRPSWLQTLRVYLEPASLRMLTLGFSAGLPLLLVLGTLSFRLREAGIDRTTIGYLSWVALTYALKWLWAPLVDRMPLPWLTRKLGQRRSWLLFSQTLIIGGLIGMAWADPLISLSTTVWCALAVAFGSATQDIALDAFRIESANADRQSALAATYQTGYRLAMIWAGAGVLWLAARAEIPYVVGYQQSAWQFAYLVMAASMLVGTIASLASNEPMPRDARLERQRLQASTEVFSTQGMRFTWPLAVAAIGVFGLLASMVQLAISTLYVIQPIACACLAALGFVGLDRQWGCLTPISIPVRPSIAPAIAWLHQALFQPFADFVGRYRRQAALILALIAVYRISDVVMGIMANPFYVDMGYTKDEVAAVTKVFGVVMTLAGAFVGGVMSMRVGVMRVLMLGALLSAASNLLFAWLAGHGHDLTALIAVVSADNLAGGIASAAFIAYLSSLTNVQYSATQYALFSSMMLLLPKWIAGFSGRFVDAYGYTEFFIGTALLGLPVLLLVWLASSIKTAPSA